MINYVWIIVSRQISPVFSYKLWSYEPIVRVRSEHKQLRYIKTESIGTSVQRSSRSAFGRSTGNDVSGHYKWHYFLLVFPVSSVVYFSHKRRAYFAKIDGRTQKPRIVSFQDFVGHFWVPSLKMIVWLFILFSDLNQKYVYKIYLEMHLNLNYIFSNIHSHFLITKSSQLTV